MRRLVVVLGQALPHFPGCNAHHRIRIRIVSGYPPENLDGDAPLFQLGGIPEQSLFHRVGQEGRVSFAVGKKGMSQQALQLLPDLGGIDQETGLNRFLRTLGYNRHSRQTFSEQAQPRRPT